MPRTTSRSSYSIVLVFLIFLGNFWGSNGFVGIGLKAKIEKKVGPSHLVTTSTPHQRVNQTPFSKVGIYNDQTTIRSTKLHAVPATIAKSLLSYGGNVPISQAFGLNLFLFVALRTKLLKMLTVNGFFHALALGTGLWATLGWRGWTTCVLYLFLGSAVTKVKFQEKEDLGIAEGRGGRRGPENVW